MCQDRSEKMSCFPYSLVSIVKSIFECFQANHVEDRCTVHHGDNRTVCPRNVADRVNLGLLPTAEMSFKTACAALKLETGGMLHIHENVRTEKDGPEVEDTSNVSNIFVGDDFRFYNNLSWRMWCFKTAETFRCIFAEIDPAREWSFQLIHLECVKSFAPYVDHLVLDLKCTPLFK